MLRGRNRALGDDEIRADSNDQAQK
jgi:hypothetical protein